MNENGSEPQPVRKLLDAMKTRRAPGVARTIAHVADTRTAEQRARDDLLLEAGRQGIPIVLCPTCGPMPQDHACNNPPADPPSSSSSSSSSSVPSSVRTEEEDVRRTTDRLVLEGLIEARPKDDAEEERRWAYQLGFHLWDHYGLDGGATLVATVGTRPLMDAIEEVERMIHKGRDVPSPAGLIYKKAKRIAAAYKRRGWSLW